MTQTTSVPAMAALLEEAMDFIRKRHNYGPRRRAEIRMSLLKRYTEMWNGRI
jgi:hypothetical protein